MPSNEISSPEEIAKSLGEGIAKGTLDWLSDNGPKLIKEFADKLRNGNLAFIEDEETINLAKKLRKDGEFIFFKQYVFDPNYRTLFQMGLTLRKLEKEKKDLSEDISNYNIELYRPSNKRIYFLNQKDEEENLIENELDNLE